jgi:membrane fusion protein, multidrug efflux system
MRMTAASARALRLALLLATPLPMACHRGPAPVSGHAFPPAPVSVTTVARRDIPITFEYLGHTEASREIEIRARVGGFLDSRHFAEGAMVAAGDLLFEIDPKPLQAQLAAAAAEVTVAEARWQQAAREAARLEPLVAEQAATEKERDDAVSAERIAAATLTSARARLQQTQLDLDYTKVKAPHDGKIGRALRPEGSLIDPNGDDGLLTTLLQLDPLYVDFQRTENQQAAIDADRSSGRLALPADGRLEVELQQRGGRVLAQGGNIDFTAGQLDMRTGTIPMRATFANPGQRLLAGQAVHVVLRGAYLKDAIAVPQRAVLDSPQGKQVYVVETGDHGTVAQPRLVEVGEWVDLEDTGPAARAWVIRSGLQPGDKVILDNLVKLRPGAAIVVDAPAAGVAGDPAPGSGAANGAPENVKDR